MPLFLSLALTLYLLLGSLRVSKSDCHAPFSGTSLPPDAEIKALVDFYNALTENGKWVDECGWSTIANISSGGGISNPCTWTGITCGPLYFVGGVGYSSVTKISFNNNNKNSNNIVGTLPASIGNLTHLTNFVFYNNSIGSLPNSIGNWSNLQEFYLENVFIGGTLPSEIGNWGKNMVDFTILGTQITGQLPESAYNWTNLKQLQLGQGPIGGVVPNAPYYWKKLTTFVLPYSGHYGPVPPGFEDLKLLTEFVIFCDGGVTTIPSTILCSKSLQSFIFVAANNKYASYDVLSACQGMRNLPLANLQIEGVNVNSEIAPDFGLTYPSIYNFWTWNTPISGRLPTSVCSTWNNRTIMRFVTMIFTNSSFTGPIPSCYFDGSVSLAGLLIDENFISGPLPVPLELPADASRLVQLSVSNNFMTGTIPSSIGQYNLIYCYLDGNAFYGHLPQEFTASSLEVLMMSNNFFSGPLPALQHAKKLFQYIAFNNHFTSSIPPMRLPSAISILLGNNHLSGKFPSVSSLNATKDLNGKNVTIVEALLPELLTFDISNNKVSGSLPYGIFSYLPRLQSFSVSLNCMDASIPEEICDATTIISLSLNGIQQNCEDKRIFIKDRSNRNLPSCIWQMPILQNLSFVGNAMNGFIPSFNISSSLVNVQGDNNLLTGNLYSLLSYQTLNSLPKSIHLKNNLLQNNKEAYHISKETLQLACDMDLTYNRMSGSMDDVVTNLNPKASFSLLSGNIFSCSTKKLIGDLDPDVFSYQCGSQDLDDNWIAFAVVSSPALLLVIALLVYTNYKSLSFEYIGHAGIMLDLLKGDFLAIFKVNSDVSIASVIDAWVAYLQGFLYIFSIAMLSSLALTLPVYASQGLRKYDYLFNWEHGGIYLIAGTNDSNKMIVLYFLWTFLATVAIFQLLRINGKYWDISKTLNHHYHHHHHNHHHNHLSYQMGDSWIADSSSKSSRSAKLGDEKGDSELRPEAGAESGDGSRSVVSNPLNTNESISIYDGKASSFSSDLGSLSLSGASVQDSRLDSADSSQSPIEKFSTRHKFLLQLLWLCELLVFLIGCAFINYFYYVSQISNKLSSRVKFIIELSYAVFKVGMYSIIIKSLFLRFSTFSKTLSYTTISVVILLLRALFPIIIVLFFSEDCFYNYFDPSTNYFIVKYAYCSTNDILTISNCNPSEKVTNSFASYSFPSMFQYSFTCSSFIAKLYIPLFMTTQVLVFMKTFCQYFYILFWSSRNKYILDSQPSTSSSSSSSSSASSLSPPLRVDGTVDDESNGSSSLPSPSTKVLNVISSFRSRFIAPNALQRGKVLNEDEAKQLLEFIKKNLIEYKVNIVSLVFTSISFGQISCIFQVTIFLHQVLQFMYLRHILVKGKYIISIYQHSIAGKSSSSSSSSSSAAAAFSTALDDDYNDLFDRSIVRLLSPVTALELLLVLFSAYVFFVIFEIDIIESPEVWIIVPYTTIFIMIYLLISNAIVKTNYCSSKCNSTGNQAEDSESAIRVQIQPGEKKDEIDLSNLVTVTSSPFIYGKNLSFTTMGLELRQNKTT